MLQAQTSTDIPQNAGISTSFYATFMMPPTPTLITTDHNHRRRQDPTTDRGECYCVHNIPRHKDKHVAPIAVAIIIIIITIITRRKQKNVYSSSLHAVPARPSRKGWLEARWSVGK